MTRKAKSDCTTKAAKADYDRGRRLGMDPQQKEKERLRVLLAMQAKRAAAKERRLAEEQEALKNKILDELDGNEIKDFTGPCCEIRFREGKQAGVAECQKELLLLKSKLAMRNTEILDLKTQPVVSRGPNPRHPSGPCSNCQSKSKEKEEMRRALLEEINILEHNLEDHGVGNCVALAEHEKEVEQLK